MGFVELRTRSFMAAGEQFDFTNGTFTWQRNRAQAKLYHNQFAGGVLRPPELLKAGAAAAASGCAGHRLQQELPAKEHHCLPATWE